MLGNLREKIISWGAKILFAILILSFGVWGIGDYITPGNIQQQPVAEVGDIEILPFELDREISQYEQSLRLSGATPEMIQSLKGRIVQEALRNIVYRDLIRLSANDMGLIVTDELVSAVIRADKQFQDQSGNFNRAAYEQFLRQTGLSEGAFIAQLRAQILEQQFLSGIRSTNAVPDALVDPIYRYRNERRIADVIRVDHKIFTDIGTPSEEELTAFHKDNEISFTAPEYRTVTVVQLRAEDVVDEIDIPEQRLQDEYQARIAQYRHPETRKLLQILVSDEETAKLAHVKIAAGEDFISVAKDAAGLDETTVDLGTVTRAQVPLPALADAAFSLGEGAVSDPIQTDLGWHIVKVETITPAKEDSFDSVRADLRRQLAEEQAVDVLFDLSNRLEDALGGGATLEEAAAQLNLKVMKIDSLNSFGLDRDNKPVEGLDKQNVIVRTAFDTPEGDESALTDIGNAGYMVLRVDKITPPALRPLAEVRDQAIAGWERQRRMDLADQKAAELMEKLKGGSSMADVASSVNAEVVKTQPFLRSGQGLGEKLSQDLPTILIADLFGLKRGEAAWAAGRNAHYMARLEDIVDAQPSSGAEQKKALSTQIANAMDQDLREQLTQALQDKYGVTVNQNNISELF